MCRILRVLLKSAETFSLEKKTWQRSSQEKIPSRSFLLLPILEETKSFLFLSTELSSTALSWMSLTQGTWTGNKQNNGKMENENRTKNGWRVTDRARVDVTFSSYFSFLGFSRPQSPNPVPRFMKVGLSNCLPESKKGFVYPHKRCHGKVMLNSSTYIAELSFDKLGE